eukprot:8051326-Alexandrium_andersonii.AAC.1
MRRVSFPRLQLRARKGHTPHRRFLALDVGARALAISRRGLAARLAYRVGGLSEVGRTRGNDRGFPR